MGFLSGRKFLIVGVLTDRSIAYGIAEAMLREGAELAFTYHSENVKEKVTKLVAKFNPAVVLPCDVSDDTQIEAAFAKLAEVWPKFNGIVHSVAFAPKEQLAGNYLDSVTRDGFRIAHDISSYSFSALAKAGLPYLEENNSALLTLSYLGAERAVPNYNVMGLAKASLEANVRYMAASVGHLGVRVNGISAGPIRTLAASGIKDFKRFLTIYEKLTPLHRNVTLEQVGNAAAFLCSDLSAGITGEILHVDSGYHAIDPLAIDGE